MRVRVSMVRDRRRVRWRRRHLVLARHHHRQPVHDGHHQALLATATPLRRVPPPALLVRHGPSEHRAPVETRIDSVLSSSSRRRVAFRPLQKTHHVRLESVRLADRRRQLRLVFVRLGVRMVALHGDCVPHAWLYHVGQALDCVRSVYFVTGHARDLVHDSQSLDHTPAGLDCSKNHFKSQACCVHKIQNTAIHVVFR